MKSNTDNWQSVKLKRAIGLYSLIKPWWIFCSVDSDGPETVCLTCTPFDTNTQKRRDHSSYRIWKQRWAHFMYLIDYKSPMESWFFVEGANPCVFRGGGGVGHQPYILSDFMINFSEIEEYLICKRWTPKSNFANNLSDSASQMPILPLTFRWAKVTDS